MAFGFAVDEAADDAHVGLQDRVPEVAMSRR
jgi:hypothetical protein